jgi:hypothetical protein
MSAAGSSAPRENRPVVREDTALLVKALQQNADMARWVEEAERCEQHAIEHSFLSLEVPWFAHDDREAKMLVYFDSREDANVIACRLLEIDFRPPSLSERHCYETEFAGEMDAKGDEWMRVVSYLWG